MNQRLKFKRLLGADIQSSHFVMDLSLCFFQVGTYNSLFKKCSPINKNSLVTDINNIYAFYVIYKSYMSSICSNRANGICHNSVKLLGSIFVNLKMQWFPAFKITIITLLIAAVLLQVERLK